MLFQTRPIIRICFYVLLWIIYVAAYGLSMYPIIAVDSTSLIVDTALHAALLAITGMLAYPVVKYGKYETMTTIQQCLNYGTLALLSVAFIVGGGYLLDVLILDESSDVFLVTLPIKGFICSLMFILFVSRFYGRNRQSESINAKVSAPVESGESERTDSETIDRVTVKDRSKIHLIPTNEIVYIESYGDYVRIVTANNRYVKEQTMKYFETGLPKNFVRVHRSYIVNVEYLSRIESSGGRNQQIALKTGDRLNISLSGYKTLKAALNL